MSPNVFAVVTGVALCISQLGSVYAGSTSAPPSIDVTKTANTSFTRTYTWEIEKTASVDDLTLGIGETDLILYTVSVLNTGWIDSDWGVSGDITVTNDGPVGVSVTSVTDVVSPDIGAALSDCSTPFALEIGAEKICAYSAALLDGIARTNTATATAQSLLDAQTVTSQVTVDVVFGDPTTSLDACVSVNDSILGDLGTVCVDDTPVTFSYSSAIGPYSDAGEYDFLNTASFVTEDTRTQGSDDAVVRVRVSAAIPEPSTLILFGLGIAGLGALRRQIRAA